MAKAARQLDATVSARLLDTLLLGISGNDVVANVLLDESKGQNSSWIAIATGVGLGVAMVVYAVNSVSGAHINPAVPIGLGNNRRIHVEQRICLLGSIALDWRSGTIERAEYCTEAAWNSALQPPIESQRQCQPRLGLLRHCGFANGIQVIRLSPMTVAGLLSDEQLRQREFPVAQRNIFLAHAGVCPLPRRVAQAVSDYAQQATANDQETLIFPAALNDGRKLAARLLNCQEDEVALVGPTSLALSFVASGLKFRKGENILIYHDDYPSNVYPWMALAQQGVEVRLLNTRGLGVIRPKDVIGQLDENTRLVALASCHFVSGYRIDHVAIGKFLRERNILFCLDAIQTLGAFPTRVEHVDFLAADGHKWLLGPCGAGLLYVRRELQEKLNPPIYGWHNVRCPNFVAQEQIVYRGGSKKFEAGTQNLLGLVGLIKAMELVLEFGVENIALELQRKRAWLVTALRERSFSVLQSDVAPEHVGSIVSFFKPGQDLGALHQRLHEANIVTSLRADRAGQRYIRLSPHFYNTEAELQRVMEMLSRA